MLYFLEYWCYNNIIFGARILKQLLAQDHKITLELEIRLLMLCWSCLQRKESGKKHIWFIFGIVNGAKNLISSWILQFWPLSFYQSLHFYVEHKKWVVIPVDRRLLLDVEVMYRRARGLYENQQFPLQHSDFYLLVFHAFLWMRKWQAPPETPQLKRVGSVALIPFQRFETEPVP